MDYEFMKKVNDIQIQKEVDERIAQDAIREKKRLVENKSTYKGDL